MNMNPYEKNRIQDSLSAGRYGLEYKLNCCDAADGYLDCQYFHPPTRHKANRFAADLSEPTIKIR